MTASALDTVPGLGAVRRRALLAKFGSVHALLQATAEQLTEVPGIGRSTAESILAHLSAQSQSSAAPTGDAPAHQPGAMITVRPHANR